MPKEALEIVITADNKSALSAIKSIVKQMESVSVSTADVSKETDRLSDIGKKFQPVAQAVKDYRFEIEKSHDAQIALNNSLDQIEKEFQQKMANMGQSANNVNKPLENVEHQIEKITAAVKENLSGTGLTKLSTTVSTNIKSSSNQAAQALQNVGRVAQDLPFGFMGIQNNLNPLLESFQRLKAESGSTSGALKAMAGSLMGAGGVGLALSVVSSAFVIYQSGIMGFNKKTEEAKKKTDEFTESLKKEREQAAGQISEMKANLAIAQNQNQTLEKRKIAVENLIQSYPAFFQGLTTENALTKDLSKNIANVTDALIKQARARAYSAQIEKLAGEDLALENKNSEIRLQKLKAENELQKERLNPTSRSGGGIGGASIGKEEILTKNIAEYNRQIVGNNIARTKIYYEQLGLQTKINKATEDTILLDAKLDKPKKEKEVKEKSIKESPLAKLAEQYKADIRGLVQMLMEGGMSFSEFRKEVDKLNVDTLKNFFKQGGDAASEFGKELISLQPAFNEFGKVIERGQVIRSEKKNTQTPGLVGVQKLEDKGLKKEQLAEPVGNLNAALMQTEQIMSVIGPQIDNLFTALEKGTSIGEAVGDMFKSLAADIAKAAVKAAIFSAILSVVSGGASTAAGGGGFFKIFGKLLGGGFAKGGVSYGPQGGHMELLHGTEAVLTPAQMSGLVRNSMNAGAIQSMGSNGGQDMNISGEFVARGQDLVLALQRSNYSLNLRRG